MSSVSGPRESAPRPLSGGFGQEVTPTKPIMSKAAAAAAAAVPAEPSVHYTCFIRLPFPRADFVDPQQVEWSSAKDRLLWKTISKASNSRELDWEELSTRFDVSLPFLLQQAAWLYERHFAQMKAQMKKLSPSANPSPIPPDSASNVSTPVIGTFPTNSLGPRATSALSSRARDSPTPTTGSGIIKPSSSSTGLANEAPFATYTSTTGPGPGSTRTPSIRTVTQSRTGATGSPAPPSTRSFRSSFGSSQRRVTVAAPQATPLDEQDIVDYDSPPLARISDSEASSSSSSDEDEKESRSMARSQAFRRPPLGRKGAAYDDEDDDDDDDEDGESSGGFLPFAATATASSRNEDVAATLRSPPPRRTTDRVSGKAGVRVGVGVGLGVGIESSASSGGSSVAAARKNPQSHSHSQSQSHHRRHHHNRNNHSQAEPASALSPRQQSLLSPRLKREGSEGAPSMGSSFSDLDDASISQSALEDAYLSNMQRGGTASRMSSISQALKSRYL